MARLHELAGEQHQQHSANQSHLDNLARLSRHLYEISDDPSGSKPNEYLSASDARILGLFLEMASELNWVDAEPIDMRAGIIKGLPVWTSSMRTAKSVLTKAAFFPKISDTQLAYVFGRLSVSRTQQVAIAEDGCLYSLRSSSELTRSNGMGWGRLPDTRYLLAAIDPSEVLLDYAPFESLEEALVSRIQPKNLPVPTS